MSKKIIEYIWLDGNSTMSQLRSKVKVTSLKGKVSWHDIELSDIPEWNFDGSSTQQGTTENSDRILKPVYICKSPFLNSDIICLCEVYKDSKTPDETNTRSKIAKLYLSKEDQKPMVAFEQEYIIRNRVTGAISGWPEAGMARPQGDYYCGIGSNNVASRNLVEKHMRYCMLSDLEYCGLNAEVMLGQWEFQMGGVGTDALTSCDQLIVSRYILEKLSEEFNLYIDYSPKPVKGDWNGSGMHCNFSTIKMRNSNGITHIEEFCKNLSRDESVQMAKSNYGHNLKSRLTGKHETSSIDDFSWGVSDRSKSIRIPINVAIDKCGYIEDRRPNSNADPYLILEVMLSNI